MFLLGLFSKRANRKGLYVGIATCVAFTGWAILTSSTVGSGEDKRLMLDLGSLNYTHHKIEPKILLYLQLLSKYEELVGTTTFYSKPVLLQVSLLMKQVEMSKVAYCLLMGPAFPHSRFYLKQPRQ